MDSKDLLWLETDPKDSHWEGYYRRTDTERDRIRDFYDVPEMLDGSENAWPSLRRRERMAEACYEC
jgi:hypothetical protein